MTRTPHPAVVALDIRSTDKDLSNDAIAKALEVCAKTVGHWRKGHRSPSMHHLLAWAALAEATPEVVDRSGEVILRGQELVDGLAGLRNSRGLSQREVADRRRVSGTAAIRDIERDAGRAGVPTYADHLAAFDVTLRLAPLSQSAAPSERTGGMTTTMPRNGACARTPTNMTPPAGDEAAEDTAREVCLSCRVFVGCLAWARTLTEKTDPGGVIAATTRTERAASAGTQACTVCRTDQAVTEFAFSDRVRRIRRRECRTCVRRHGRALQVATAAARRATRKTAAERVAA